ncbi:hypothetical protein ACONG6_003545 [Vibrio cholerae]
MQDSNNYLKINWGEKQTHTQIPFSVSSICKYKGKKLSTDHKLIYCYLHKLQFDGKINNSGVASFDAILNRFGIGSKGTLTGYIDHLVDVGLLVKKCEGNGHRNTYQVLDLDLDLITYPSKSHTKDSNKNKRKEKKVDNFMIAKKYRKLFEDEPDKVKALNKFVWQADQDGVKLDSGKIQEFLRSLEQPTPEQAPSIQQPQAEPMLCNGDESYFTEQPPLSVYENDYVVEDEDLEVVVDSQVSIEDCPKFVMCESEWQSVIESYTVTDIEQATQQASEAVAPSQTDEVIERVEPPITPPPETPKQQEVNPFVLCRELLSTAKHGVYMQHKANLLRIGKLGAMVNAIKQGYVYNDVFHENSLEVVSGAIHAIYEHSQHEQLNDADVLLYAKAMLENANAKQEVTKTFSNHLSSVVISEQSYEQPEPEDYIDDLPF